MSDMTNADATMNEQGSNAGGEASAAGAALRATIPPSPAQVAATNAAIETFVLRATRR